MSTTSNWPERNKTLIRCGKYSTKKLIWENPHLSFIMTTWDVLKRPCEISKDIVDIYRTKFESRISARATEKLPYSENLRISSWSYDMESHARKCVERSCGLANKTTQQLYKVSTPCIDDHHFKEAELKSVGEVSKVCSHIVLKCLYLARVGRLDILWSVNKLARSFTKWTKVCDKRLSRLISYIQHTSENKQYCYVGNSAKQCRLGLFQDSDFAGDLEDSKSASGGTLCVFGSHTFVPISWICKKQTSVSHSSTESEIISLDAGLRLDGIPALDSWDLTVTVLGNHESEPKRTEVYHDTSGQNHGPVWKTQSFLSKGVYTDTHLLVTCGKGDSRKFLRNLDGKSFKLGMYVRSSETRIISVSIRGWHKNGCKEAEYGSHVEEKCETCWSWRTHIVSWSRVFGMHSTWMQTEWNYYWRIFKGVWIMYFCWSNWKITRVGETSRKDGRVVLRHGGALSKMRWAILGTDKQESGAVK